MNKFKIGDRVMMSRVYDYDCDYKMLKGLVGTVMEDNSVPYVQWDDFYYDNPILIGTPFVGCYAICEEQLILVYDTKHQLMNGKIKVSWYGISSLAKSCFGEIGTEFEVVNGEFQDLDGFTWRNKMNVPFSDLASINSYLDVGESWLDKMHQCRFELVEEDK